MERCRQLVARAQRRPTCRWVSKPRTADDNDYLVTVTATEERAEGVASAESTEQDITVTVTNVEEPGTVSP